MSDVKLGLVHGFPDLQSSGTYDQTDSNFGGASPVAVLKLMNYATAVNTATNHAQIAIGGAKSGTQGEHFMFSCVSENAQGSTDTYRQQMDTKVGWIHNPGNGSRDGWTDFDSFVTNGARFDVTNTYNNDYSCLSLLFGGADLDVDVGTFEVSSDTVGSTHRGYHKYQYD